MKKIAIIGGNRLGKSTMIEALRTAGHEVVETKTGEKIRGQEFDMCFIDECLELELEYTKPAPIPYDFNKSKLRRKGQKKGTRPWE